jgi:enediyne biosynthesis protein E4
MNMKTWVSLLLPLFLLAAPQCRKTGKEKQTLFTLMSETGIQFKNTVNNSSEFNIFSYRNFYNGGGVATGDINNDGLADVCFTANMSENKLYLNKGNFQFEDISQKAGIGLKDKWSTGVVMVDINNDGWLDIYVCNAGYRAGVGTENALFINNHNNTFTDSAAAYGLNDNGYTTHAAFFDYDLDGDLDCYILNNSFIPVNTLNYANKRELRAEDWPVADFLKGGGDKLMRNDKGHFTDVSKEANIYGSLIGFGLGVTVGDLNGDHYPDIYISNDFFERDYLYINQKNGTFTESLEKWVQHTSHSSMGADMADINNDGYPDIFSTDMLPGNDYRLKTTSSFENTDVNNYKIQQGFYYQYMQNALQVNNRNGKFYETAYFSGVAASDWSWGALVFDADNDGLSDIYVCNGIYHDVTDQDFIDFFANDVIQKMALTGKKEEINDVIAHMPSVPISNKMFHNKGNLKFSAAETEWGMDKPSFSNGAAYADLDNDGDLDMVVNNVNQDAFVYKNNTRETKPGNHYIGFMLKGKGQNTFALGTQIKIFSGTQVITREVIPSRGFQSSVDYKIIAGLGNQRADSVLITWPDRTQTRIDKPMADTVLHISQTGTTNFNDATGAQVATMLTSVTNNFEAHTEDAFNDFYYERNLPMMLSHEGPKATTADINNDGLTDLFIGGAAKQPAQLYIQKPGGRFERNKQSCFDTDADAEDVAVLFFDCDGDKDYDLIVGSGGNIYTTGSPEIQNRLYINDGKGNFTRNLTALPASGGNTSVITAYDYDHDGDNDLFVGCRSTPRNYGVSPNNAIYQNNGAGKFSDVTKQLAPGIAGIGMITGAVWANMNGDTANKQLLLCGDWMAPRIFAYKNNRFTEMITSMKNMNGWWQTVQAADLDGDGDDDLVLGNNGENYYLQPTVTSPVKLFMGDYDGNGTTDKIYTRTQNGKEVPVFLKKEFTEQLPSFKKQNLKHSDFAKKTITDLLSGTQLKNSTVRECNYASSCIAWNEGDGKFTIATLPLTVQFSSVNAVWCTDVNGDGLPDLLAGGNNYHCLPQFSRLDASFGHLLLNKGKRQFAEIQPGESGIVIEGEVRDILSINIKQEKNILFLRNNNTPLLYKVR